MDATSLPGQSERPPVPSPHFPDRLHAYVWRNWQLVPLDRLAAVVGAEPASLMEVGRSMGLQGPPRITPTQQRRSAITVIRRNWHLLPYEQLLTLLGWTPEELAYALQEDDFLFIKLGRLKPRCAPLAYAAPAESARRRAAEIAAVVRRRFPDGVGEVGDPFFSFVERLSRPADQPAQPASSLFSPRFSYCYFALYGDPLLDEEAGLYPDGYLARLAGRGVDGVWLQGVLYTLAPFPWEPQRSARAQERLVALRALVERARRHGIGIYLYLNEPRSFPLNFFAAHPDLQGVVEGDHAVLCTSVPAVRDYLRTAVATVCSAVPDLAGILTITASENLTNCWSHYRGQECPRCGPRGAPAVVSGVNALILDGIRRSGSKTRLLAWDWGWPDDWAEEAITSLPDGVALMSVSEWDLPIRRGGVESRVGEYSLSAIGPGPRAQRHWAVARERGLGAVACIQAASTSELSAVPYVPVVENAAQHAANLRGQVDGLMLGWTLDGYPSPNMEAIAAVARDATVTPAQALEEVARRRFGRSWPALVAAWQDFSRAMKEFPFHIAVVYQGPTHWGPSLPWWESPTGYRATMFGFPYDDLDGWRAVYPPDTFAAQCDAVASGFGAGIATLQQALAEAADEDRAALREELTIAEAVAIHLRSAANTARFIMARDAPATARSVDEARAHRTLLEHLLHDEISLAEHLYRLQMGDARIGFEASNQYYYVPLDLVEKVLICHDLQERWLPTTGF